MIGERIVGPSDFISVISYLFLSQFFMLLFMGVMGVA
jgi:hypothetical protein